MGMRSESSATRPLKLMVSEVESPRVTLPLAMMAPLVVRSPVRVVAPVTARVLSRVVAPVI